MSDKSSLIERVRKLLARTEESGCTPAEAEAAYAMATRIMAEHNLAMSEVSQQQEEWVKEEADAHGRFDLERNLTYGIVQEFCFVQGVLGTKHRETESGFKRMRVLTFFGKPENVESAKWMFQSLIAAYDRLFSEYRARTRCPLSDRRAFVVGMADGFVAKMREERRILEAERDITSGKPQSTALAILGIQEQTRKAFQKAYPKARSTSAQYAPVTGSQSAFQEGYNSGRNLNLSRGVEARQSKALPG